MPALYIVSTPIGNLEDISLRALRILGEVKLIAAEDTRTTRNLLAKYNIRTPLTSYHEHNKFKKLSYLLELLKVEDIALVSEAGMPGVSDTGDVLIKEAIENDIRVVAIPGACAIINALVVSGLPIGRFNYIGFLPRKKGERRKLLKSLVDEKVTLVLFEAPHRLVDSLHDILNLLGNRRLAVCREMTKVHEEIFRGSVSEAIEHFIGARGEFTIILEGSSKQKSEDDPLLEVEILRLQKKKLKTKEAVNLLSEKTGFSKKKLYNLWLQLSKGD